jgi:hypothetical protein
MMTVAKKPLCAAIKPGARRHGDAIGGVLANAGEPRKFEAADFGGIPRGGNFPEIFEITFIWDPA